MQPTRPTRHAIASSIFIFGTIVFLGSFHNVHESIGLATLFVGFPWFVYYFLEWLGGEVARSFKEEIDREHSKKGIRL